MAEIVSVVIADDEPLARRVVRDLLAERGGFRVVAECRDGDATVRAVKAHRPDLLFLDVRMPARDGLETLAALETDQLPALVFVTAYADFALPAFEAAAVDYLVKPFTDARFDRTVERVRRWLAGRRPEGKDPAFVTRLLATVGRRSIPIEVSRIDWIEAHGFYVRVHSAGDTWLVRRALTRLERELDPKRFVRCHRGAIVNVRAIRAVERGPGGARSLLLAGGTTVPVSERRRRALNHLLATGSS
jgi:two-component system LytT family response regulator